MLQLQFKSLSISALLLHLKQTHNFFLFLFSEGYDWKKCQFVDEDKCTFVYQYRYSGSKVVIEAEKETSKKANLYHVLIKNQILPS